MVFAFTTPHLAFSCLSPTHSAHSNRYRIFKTTLMHIIIYHGAKFGVRVSG